MQRMFTAMGLTLAAIAIGLVIYAETADRQMRITELGNTLPGAYQVDPGSGGTPYRIGAAVSGGLAAVLIVGAIAAPTGAQSRND